MGRGEEGHVQPGVREESETELGCNVPQVWHALHCPVDDADIMMM
jgi:hypothetical protein